MEGSTPSARTVNKRGKMSWSLSVPARYAYGELGVTAEDFEADADKVWTEQKVNLDFLKYQVPEAVEDQFQVVKKAAKAILDSGAVGTGVTYQVSLGGHANKEHQPNGGWANDAITININQVTVKNDRS